MKTFLTLLLLVAIAVGAWYLYPRMINGENVENPDESKPATAVEAERAQELLEKARLAGREAKPDTAMKIYEDIIEKYGNTWAGRQANLEVGNLYEKKGRKQDAVDAFREGLPNVEGKKREEILAAIDKLELELANAGAQHAPIKKSDSIYTVKRLDILGKIAKRYNTSVEQIMLANNRRHDRIRPGDRIKITYKMPTITVSKKRLKLILRFDGKVIRSYDICIGQGDKTPAGVFKVTEKTVNPPWTKTKDDGSKEVIPYGDPRNILGSRWLTLKGPGSGYGIHGTTKPETIPGRSSAGCVRMFNKDVEELFDWTPRGTKTTITDD